MLNNNEFQHGNGISLSRNGTKIIKSNMQIIISDGSRYGALKDDTVLHRGYTSLL